MSAITLDTILEETNHRDGQKALRKIIEKQVEKFDLADDVGRLVGCAQSSYLINSDAPSSKKIASVTFNQILDRMTTNALVTTINYIEKGYGIASLEECFLEAEEHATGYEAWPYPLIDTDWTYTTTDVSRYVDDFDKEIVSEPTEEVATQSSNETPDEFEVDGKMIEIANLAMTKATNGVYTDICQMHWNMEDLRKQVKELLARPSAKPAPQAVPSNGDIPEGRPIRVNANDVFKTGNKLLDFDITYYEWDGPNPLVPQVMPHFKYDIDALADLLWARETKKNAWLVGHTGTGKSTLVEQVCASTGTMFQRVNFDSEITRFEFVGDKDIVIDDDGNQVTKFKDGILPTVMQMPCVLMLDEADAIRGDIAYVLQPVLEGKSLRLLEDGGRMVNPHPDFSIVATANTTGSGDSTGLYSAAVKMQSTAAMNRYNVFIKVDYMEVDTEMEMVSELVPSMSKGIKQKLGSFITHYRKALKIGEVSKPISPRNSITIAEYATDFEKLIGTDEAFARALERNLFNAMDDGERSIATGIADRNQA